MDITLDTKQFKDAVNFAYKMQDARCVIPILSTVRLQCESGLLSVCGTNLDRTVFNDLNTNGKDAVNFDICVDGKLLFNLLNRITNESVDIEITESSVIITSENSDISAKLALTQGERFPEVGIDLYEITEEWVTFSVSDLLSAFTGTLRVVGNDRDRIGTQLKGFLKSVSLDVTPTLIESKFSITGTDGRRFALITGDCHRTDEVTNKEPSQMAILISAAETLSPVLNAVRNQFQEVQIADTKNHTVVKFSKAFYFIFRKSTEAFPNLSMLLDAFKPQTHLTVNAEDLTKTLELVDLFTDPRSRSARFDIENDSLTLKAISAEVGEITEIVEVKNKEGLKVSASFDLSYLLPVLRLLSGGIEIQMYRIETLKKSAVGKAVSSGVSHQMKIVSTQRLVRSEYLIQGLTI
jgi:DNA polymerase III sliding clamp (beta) subunit (PCNA family)